MRKFQFAAVAAAFVGVALLAGASTARANDTERVTVKFPFEVSGVMMPAGTYVAVQSYSDPGLVQIRSMDGRYAAFVNVLDSERLGHVGTAQFDFVRAGNRYYLSRISDGRGDVEHIVTSDTTTTQALHELGHDLNPRNW